MPGAPQRHVAVSILLILHTSRVVLCTLAASTARDDDKTPPRVRRSLEMDKVDINLLFGTPEGKRSLHQLETAPSIAATTALLLGVALCCFGARHVKYAMLGCAFLDGAVFISLLLQNLHVLQGGDGTGSGGEEWENMASWACFFLGGTLLCLIVLANDALGRFVVGLTAGMMLAFSCNTSFGYSFSEGHPQIVLIALLAGLGTICGLLTVKSHRAAVIIATSWIGANAMTWGAGYFVGNYPNGASLEKYRHQRGATLEYAIPKEWWGYLAGTIVCCTLGCFVQHCITTKEKKKRERRVRMRQNTHYMSAATPRVRRGPADLHPTLHESV